jgi:hypothetical protein
MADTTGAPESRTLLLRRIAQLEDDLAETRECVVRLASVIECLLIDEPQFAADMDAPDAADWVAPVVPLEPGRRRRTGLLGANRRLPRHGSEPQTPSPCFIR